MPPHGAYLYIDAGQGLHQPWGWFYYSPDITLCQRVFNVMQPDLYDGGGLLYIFTSDELGDDWIRADDALERAGDPKFHHEDLYERAQAIVKKLSPTSSTQRTSSIAPTSATQRSSERRALHSIICFSDSENCEDWTGFATIESPVVAQAITMYLQRRYGKVDKVNFCVVDPSQVGLWLFAQDQVEETAEVFLGVLEDTRGRSFAEAHAREANENYLKFAPHEIDEDYSGSLRYHMAAMRKHAVLAKMDEGQLSETFHEVLGGFDALDDDLEEERQSPKSNDSDSETSATVDPNQCTHADDFTWVIWFGERYKFSKGNQAEAVRALWLNWEKSGQRDGFGMSEKTIGEKCGSSSSNFRVQPTFRGHQALNTMIRSTGKGTYALFSPKSQDYPTS